MRVTGFDLRVASEDATASVLVLNMQWVSLKDTPPNTLLALKTHTQPAPSKPVESNRDSLEVNPVPLLSKPAFLHNPFSVQSLKSGLPLVASSKTAPPASPLQTKPLSQMRFAGSMTAGEKRQALIGLDGLIYSVSPGERLGQDWGEVTQIEPDHVWLREWFADELVDQGLTQLF
jgi:type IV pilus assembly protein PilP